MFWKIFEALCIQLSKAPNAVCKELGFSSATATHWKHGKIPGATSLEKIALYFDVSIDYLLGKTADPSADVQTSLDRITPREKAVLLAYREKKDMQTAVERLLDVKIEDHPEEPIAPAKEPQEPEYDDFMKRVDALTDHGRIKPQDAKIAAFGGYEQPATGKEAEELAEIKRLLQDVIDEQRKQRGE